MAGASVADLEVDAVAAGGVVEGVAAVQLLARSSAVVRQDLRSITLPVQIFAHDVPGLACQANRPPGDIRSYSFCSIPGPWLYECDDPLGLTVAAARANGPSHGGVTPTDPRREVRWPPVR